MLDFTAQWITIVGGIIAIVATLLGWLLLVKSPITITFKDMLDANHNSVQAVEILNHSTRPVVIREGVFRFDGWLRRPLLVDCTEEEPYGGNPLQDYELQPSKVVLGVIDDRYDGELFEMVEELKDPRGLKKGWAEIKHTLRKKPVRSKVVMSRYFNLWFEEAQQKKRKRR